MEVLDLLEEEIIELEAEEDPISALTRHDHSVIEILVT